MKPIDMEVLVDDTVPADGWAAADPKVLALDASAELQSLVDQFLARGGSITVVEPGATAMPDARGVFNQPAHPHKVAPAARQRKEAVQYKRVKSVIAADAAAAEKMDGLLAGPQTISSLAKAMGSSVDKVQRLLRDHFADDQRAEPFQKRTVEERRARYDAMILPKLQKAMADGVVGMHNLADLCGTSYAYVLSISKRLKLDIPKATGGRKLGRKSDDKKQTRKYTGSAECLNQACRLPVLARAYYCQACGHVTAKGLEKGAEE